MPAKMKSASKKSASTAVARAKVGEVMSEFKQGRLKSGSGQKVRNPKQAIAIGLSEARQAGAHIPAKKKSAAAKKAAAKKPATKTTAARKSSPRRKG